MKEDSLLIGQEYAKVTRISSHESPSSNANYPIEDTKYKNHHILIHQAHLFNIQFLLWIFNFSTLLTGAQVFTFNDAAAVVL